MAMTARCNNEIWNAKTISLSSISAIASTEALNLCRDDFLDIQFHVWLSYHIPHAQHDAGEFAGWLRGAIFEKLLTSIGIPFHELEIWFAMSFEDRGTLISHIVLHNMPSDRASLQEFVEAWQHYAPFRTILYIALYACNLRTTLP